VNLAFATTSDIAVRLKETTLSAEDEASAALLLELATAIIADAAGKSEDWANELDPVPRVLWGLTIELVCRAMASPQGLVSATETLGARSRSESYRRDLSSALVLTPQEERLVRSAVYGTLAGSSTPRALVDRLIDLAENRDVDAVEA
jgi:hypothetical protein